MLKQHFILLATLSLSLFPLLNQAQSRQNLTPEFKPFYHGVASGDPTPNEVIIWTRCTPDTGIDEDLDVYWQMATDTSFTNIVNYGYAKAKGENDYTVKVDVCGLQPNTWYYYMFQHGGKSSITGRTRTAPDPNSDNDSAYFAIVSCASYEHGYFNAYQNIADRNEVDAVVHLGDYIYEYKTGDYSSNISGRTYDPQNEAVTENDYRLRHSLYKLDYQLRRCHQMFPFINVWDDHELANDTWKGGAENHQASEGAWDARKRGSVNAYFEWIPIRKPDLADTFRIFRNVRWGKLLNLVMLDSRLYDRDEQDGGRSNDPTHYLLGPYQMQWMLNQLDDTLSKWKIIGNQVMFAPFKILGIAANNDQWDGYAAERDRVQNHIINNNIKNMVVLTGDIHTSWCNDIPGPNYNSSTGAGSLGVEFVGTSITSQSLPFNVGTALIKSMNSHMKYIELSSHGYYTLDIRKNKTQADYRFVPRDAISNTETAGESWYVNASESFLRKASAQVPHAKVNAFIPSLFPNNTLPFTKIDRSYHANTLQNNPLSVVVIPNAAVCPAIGLQIIQAPAYGDATVVNNRDILYEPSANFSGYDTIYTLVCETANPTACDTIPIFIEVIAVTKTDTIEVAINSGEVYSNCHAFDDLYETVSSSIEGAYNGAAVWNNDSCILYTPTSDFCGYENIYAIGCDNSNPAKCDTVYYRFRINLPVVKDAVSISVRQNDTIHYCIQYNDLVSKVNSSQVLTQPQIGDIEFVNDTCFNYVSNTTGQTVLVVTGCDDCNIQNCDTLEIQINIVSDFSTETFTYSGVGGTPIPVCYSFDEVNTPFSSVNLIHSSNNGLIQVLSDTCFNYIAPNGYTGIDTIYAVACNNIATDNCDTARLIIYTGVSSVKDEDDFAVLGIYPNPFADGLVIQYYNYRQTDIICNIFDINGKIAKSQVLKGNQLGLQHTFVATDNLSSGTYLIEVKDKLDSYRKQLIKH